MSPASVWKENSQAEAPGEAQGNLEGQELDP